MSNENDQICGACKSGRHGHHDTWGRGPARGQDAGCPNAVQGNISRECRCPVRMPRPVTAKVACPTCGHVS